LDRTAVVLEVEVARDDEQVLPTRIHSEPDREINLILGYVEALPGAKTTTEENTRD
jgi:hypothetical protein